ncbi:unnamed protein product [Microthlaspi erraticum]|uniref:Uncharacterized protein n=1 Tax=Microthlaspi erraticum TaxID=1685480 RepID=A0A6D2KQ81_9BRAS|nr:unnamed protein product [Microthlaspi erraticum]
MSSSPATNGEEPLLKRPKRKKKPSLALTQTSSSQSTPVPSLPDDLLISCFARISRLHYPALSLASKSFRSHLASPELYETRSLLGRAESCLYVCLQFPPYPNPNPRWFTLCRKPDRILTNENTSETKKKKKETSSGNILVPISVPKSPQTHRQCVVAVGSSIYSIGGPIDGSPSASVWVLDCHCHVWRKAPSMLVERENPAANVFDGKIYVAGGCRDFNSSNWMEVFDPKTQTWELVMCPLAERCKSSMYKSAVVEGRIFYMFGDGGVAYKPEDGSWEAIGALTYLELGWSWRSYCVIDNVLFCFSDSDGFEWYDSKRQVWMNMRGILRGLPNFAGHVCVKMADYGGKLAVFWTKGYKEKRIWCAVIAIERRKSDKEVWGTVEWSDPVLTIPTSFDFVRALSATV